MSPNINSQTPPQALPRIIPTREVVPTMKSIIARNIAVRKAIVDNIALIDAVFCNVIRPLADIQNQCNGEIAIIAMLRYASPDQAAREASDEAIELLVEDESNFTSDENLYRIVKAVKDKNEPLEVEEAKYLDLMLRGFAHCGHGRLSLDQMSLHLENKKKIEALTREFNRNIRNDTTGLWFSMEEIDGVPERDLARFPVGQDPQEGLDKNTKRFVRCTRGDVNAILQYARNPVTRKRLYVANDKRVPQNVELFKEACVRRDTNARHLGYASHAALKLETHIARTPDWVENLMDTLEDLLLPLGRREMNSLLARMQQDNLDISNGMQPWDYQYYSRLELEVLNVQYDEISEYFPLHNTVVAMLDLFSACLQLKFIPVATELLAGSIWHEDVDVWSVWDTREATKDDFIGYLYTDLLWRPKKHTGSQNVNLQAGYRKPDGTRVYPATTLMCSFPRPTESGCALLKQSEIVSLFHELGHGIHDLVAKTSLSRFHGHHTAPDFNEIPSVMLENWCWMSTELKEMSCHYTTLKPEYLRKWQEKHPGKSSPPTKIPEKMLDGLVKSRNIHRALWILRQLAFARIDMTVHNPSSHEECLKLDPTSIFNDQMARLRMVQNPESSDRGHAQSTWHHPLSGMDAGYYSYLSSAVVAADIFQNTFAEDPRNQAAWERYRRAILEHGGSRDELQMVTDFLGHSPDPQYLARSLGH